MIEAEFIFDEVLKAIQDAVPEAELEVAREPMPSTGTRSVTAIFEREPADHPHAPGRRKRYVQIVVMPTEF